MIDVVINFRITYISKKSGEEELNLKNIAINYLKGRFWIDILASMPFDVVTLFFMSSNKEHTNYFRAFGLLKLIRITRLSKIIAYLNLRDDIKISLKLAKLIFFLFLYLHCQGCFWYMVVIQDDKWISVIDQIDGVSTFYDQNFFTSYLLSLYHSTLVLTFNDIFPVNLVQLIIMSFLVVISAIINASLLGNVVVLVSALSKKTTDFQEKLDTVNTSMKNMKLPEDKQAVIREFIVSSHNFLGAQQEMQKFLNTLSPSLKTEVTRHIFGIMTAKSSLFKSHKEVENYLSWYVPLQ